MSNFFKNPRITRHRRTRARLAGTTECPRLAVYRSLKHISVQLIDDIKAHTICAASDHELENKKSAGKPIELAKAVGKLVAEKAVAKGIKTVVFDRGGYAYHGRIKALAEGARAGGLIF
jgi:large subunit ribosomal protein L18